MFSVFLYQIACDCERLQQIVYCQRNEIDNINDVISALRSLSGMSEVISDLTSRRMKLEERLQSMLDLLQGLEKIRLCYQNVERKIYDNGDGYIIPDKRSIYMDTMDFFSNNVRIPPIMIE